jgi:hypothetical protein
MRKPVWSKYSNVLMRQQINIWWLLMAEKHNWTRLLS